MSQQAIADKHASLRAIGFDLGEPTGPEVRFNPKGLLQRYAHGNIYWHPDNGPHEVHGAILAEYERRGGPEVESSSGRNLLGFPVTDEVLSPDGAGRQSTFATGTIQYSTQTGAVMIEGPLWRAWQRDAIVLGHPLCPAVSAPASHEMLLCRGGIVITTGPANDGSILRYAGPLMGNPAIMAPDGEQIPLFTSPGGFLRAEFNSDELAWMDANAQNYVAAALNGRVALMAVGDDTTVPLALTEVRLPIPGGARLVVTARLASGARLEDRTLYDLVVLPDSGRPLVMVPHCVYAKTDWSRFGAMHATDIHVARRLDHFWRKLGRLGLPESQAAFLNWNESFRKLIREANRLHSIGALDIIIMTGDLVDQQLEPGEADEDAGNFLFFEEIVRGMSPSPEGRVVQELRVPILTTLGNHDYRIPPYELYFESSYLGISKTISQFDSLNLRRKDATLLQDGEKLKLSSDEALRMVSPVRRPLYYMRRINRETDSNDSNSYVVALGPHRIVMLDSGPDIGAPDGFGDILWGEISDNEDYDAAKGGSPNQVGVLPAHLGLVSAAMRATPLGLVVIGIHGPPVNIKGSQFEDCLRETTHPTAGMDDLVSFLSRADPDSVEPLLAALHGLPPLSRYPLNAEGFRKYREQLEQLARSRHESWTGSLGKRYFKYGTVDDLLDEGASKGRMDDFLRLVAGDGAGRAAELILCGHGHDHVEFRVETKPSGLRFYTDYYTATPNAYYGTFRLGSDAGDLRIAVIPKAGAAANAPPVKALVQEHWAETEWQQEVPPYADPLDKSPDPQGWWQRHRPIIRQTAAVGPIESRSNTRKRDDKKMRPDASFRGYGLISVAGNVIEHIRHRRMDEILDEARPRADWEVWEGATIRLASVWKPAVSLVIGSVPPVLAGDVARGPVLPQIPGLPRGPLGPRIEPADPGTGRWRLEPMGGRTYRIREAENSWQRCLNIESGALERGLAEPGWLSARWRFEDTGGGRYRIRNLWKPDHCVHIESGRPAAGPVETGWLSALWTVDFYV